MVHTNLKILSDLINLSYILVLACQFKMLNIYIYSQVRPAHKHQVTGLL